MSKLLGLSSGGASSIVSYYGPMSFLDDQALFISVFGLKSPLFESSPARLDSDSTGAKLRAYADKCMFDISLTSAEKITLGLTMAHQNLRWCTKSVKKLAYA